MKTMGNYVQYSNIYHKRKKYSQKKTFTVYVLQLENEKYYVGLSKDVDRRFQEHQTGVGAKWTKKYPPIKVVYKMVTSHTAYLYASTIENLKTIEYMKKYGKENVRGGTYCAVEQCIINEQLGNDLCKQIDKESKAYLAKKQRELDKKEKKKNKYKKYNRSVATSIKNDKLQQQSCGIEKIEISNAKKHMIVQMMNESNDDTQKNSKKIDEKDVKKFEKIFSEEEKRNAMAVSMHRNAIPIKKKITSKCNIPTCGKPVIKMSYGSMCSVCGQRYVFKKR